MSVKITEFTLNTSALLWRFRRRKETEVENDGESCTVSGQLDEKKNDSQMTNFVDKVDIRRLWKTF